MLSRWRPRNWSVAVKLSAVVLIPVATAGVLAYATVAGQVTVSHEDAQARQEVVLAATTGDVIRAVQAEREAMVSFVAADRVGPQTSVVDTTQRVRNAVAVLKTVAATPPAVSAVVASGVEDAELGLADLDSIRSASVNTALPAEAVSTLYDDVVASLTRIGQLVASDIGSPTQAAQANAVTILQQAQEHLAQENAVLIAATQRGHLLPEQDQTLVADQAAADAELDEFGRTADPITQQLVHDTVSGPDVDTQRRLAHLAVLEAGPGPLSIHTAEAEQAGTATIDLMARAVAEVSNGLHVELDAQAQHAAKTAERDALLTGTVLLATLVITTLIVRSLIRSLRALRRTVQVTSDTYLPEAVRRILEHDGDAASDAANVPFQRLRGDEVGQVGEAVNRMWTTAIGLASDLAVAGRTNTTMLATIARKSQGLVRRLTVWFDAIERDQLDPAVLADFFTADHTVAIMAHAGECQLVLAGDPPHHKREDTAIAEIVRAAQSRVEHYDRIELDGIEDVLVQGRVMYHLMVMITCLLDNAAAAGTNPVHVKAKLIGRRNPCLVVEIRDRGLGFDPKELPYWQALVADPPELVANVERVGLRVTGLLARWHGVQVELRNNADIDGGATAQLTIPNTLLARNTRESQFPAITPGQYRGPAADATAPAEATGPSVPIDVVGQDQNVWRPWDRAPRRAADPAASADWPHILPVAQRDDGPPTERVEELARPFQVLDECGLGADSLSLQQTVWQQVAGTSARVQALADKKWDTTEAGLPRRVPRACLIAGSVEGPRHRAEPLSPDLDPAQIRDRFANYAAGVRRAEGSPAPDTSAAS